MDKYERAIMEAQYIIETKKTVREISKVFGVSKSTIHLDLTDRLKECHSPLYAEVVQILEEHRLMRHIRGGAATKAKYAEIDKEVSA